MPGSSHSTVEIPVLETARLRLRGHRLDDFIHSAAMWANPKVALHTSGKPLTEEESWTKFLRYAGHWQLLGFGYWAAEEKSTGEFIGEVGFADYKRELKPALNGIPEIGWVLAPQAHGKGYATEAARAAIAWGDALFQSARTACIIDPENLASIRVAEKCGYQEFTRTTYKGQSVILLARERAPG